MGKIRCILSILLFSFFLQIPSMALSVSTDKEMFYTYTATGEAIESPAAYTPVCLLGGIELGITDGFAPTDIYVEDNIVYVIDTQANRLYILDAELKLLNIIEKLTGTKNSTLNQPEGVFVDVNGQIYIADTKNKRIVMCDRQGNVKKEWGDVKISVMGENIDFFPSKLTVDKAGRMFVVCNNINRGVVELNEDGEFAGFIGTPDVKVDMVTYFWKLISTAEQRKRMESFVPTEFNNITIDDEGFLYATIGTLDSDKLYNVIRSKDTSGSITPIKKLNAAGEDILHRSATFPPVGDLEFDTQEGASIIVDVAVGESGMYTLIDGKRQRVFTYDQDGNLLYIFGGSGDRMGHFQSLSSVCYIGNRLLFADSVAGYLTLMEPTDYGESVIEAIKLVYNGDFESADQFLNRALSYNANLYMAYLGKGIATYRQGNYKQAMEYYKVIGETKNYGEAKRAYQKELLEEYMIFFWIAGAVIIVLFVVGAMVKARKKRFRKKGGNGNDIH